jgi:Na+/H+ antiporter NhaD/arsenite permease-like protein
MSHEFIALIIFVVVYASIIFNLVPRSIIALTGALLLVLTGILSVQEMASFINWDALGLIFGMFVLVKMFRDSGFFDFLSVWALKKTKGIPVLILFYFAILAGVLSTVMNSITVLLFMSAISVEIAKKLKVSPVPFVLSQITAANIGGSATLIGNPSNIIIGTGLNFTFFQFMKDLAPISIFIMFLNTAYFVLYYRKTFLTLRPMEDEYLKTLNPITKINDFPLMISTLISFVITIILIFVRKNFGLSIGIVGLIGASLALILSGKKMEHIWEGIDWEVLIFFAALFLIIGGLEKTNIINNLGALTARLTSNNVSLSKGVLLWSSAFLSGVIDNVPFVASMVPLLKSFAALSPGISLISLGVVVTFGANAGGNFTPIGASPNVVGLTVLSRAGVDVTWKDYLKVIVPITFIDVMVAWLIFLIF